MPAQPVVKSELPASNAVAVTPNDSTDLLFVTRGLFVGGGGNIVVIMGDQAVDATTVTFTGVPAGTILPIAVRRVRSTSTTATNIVALW